jgi:hypothetical protein
LVWSDLDWFDVVGAVGGGGLGADPHGFRDEVMAATPGLAATKYPPVTPSATIRCPFALGTMAAELDLSAAHLAVGVPLRKMSTPVPCLMQNDPPLSAVLRVRVRCGGDVGVAEPQAAAAGAPLPDDPLAAEPAACCPQAAVSADNPTTAAPARNETLRMHTSE